MNDDENGYIYLSKIRPTPPPPPTNLVRKKVSRSSSTLYL